MTTETYPIPPFDAPFGKLAAVTAETIQLGERSAGVMV